MDEDRFAGAAQKLGGTAKEKAGEIVGDAKLQAEGKADQVAGTVRNAVGGAKDTAREWGDDIQGELTQLRGQVERLMRESITPALANAAETAEEYATKAKDIVAEQSERVAGLVKERPLLAVGLAAAGGFLLGRLMGSNTYVYPRR